MGVSFRRWVSSFLPLYSLALRVGGEPRGGPGSDGGTFEAAGGELSPALRSGSVPRTDRSAPVVGRHLPAAFMRPVPSRAAVTPGKGQDVATVPRGGLPGGRGQWALQARSCWGAGARCARRRLQPRIRHLGRWLSPRSLPRWPGPWEAARTGRLAAAAGVPPPAGTPGTPPPPQPRPTETRLRRRGRETQTQEGGEREVFARRAARRPSSVRSPWRGQALRACHASARASAPLARLGVRLRRWGLWPRGVRGGPCGAPRALPAVPRVGSGRPRRRLRLGRRIWPLAPPRRALHSGCVDGPARHGFLLQESRLLEGLPSLPPSGRRVSRRWGPTGGRDREG